MTLALAVSPLYAEKELDDEITLGNVEVVREKTTFVVSYDLTMGGDVSLCDIVLMLSTDAGQTFSSVEKRHLSGDFGKVRNSGKKAIYYDFSQDAGLLDGKKIAFKVEVARKEAIKSDFLVSAQVSVAPSVTYGVMFGMLGKWGWYAKVRSDFNFQTPAYNVAVADGNFWGTGDIRTSRLNITAGTMVRTTNWLYPYVGAGYGSRSLYWEDIDKKWALVSDRSVTGLSLDAGVVLKFWKIALTAGVSTTMFKYTEAELGVGIIF